MKIDVRAVDPDGAILAEWLDPDATVDDDGTFRFRLTDKPLLGRLAALEMTVDGVPICHRSIVRWPPMRADYDVAIEWEGRITDSEDWMP